MNCKLLFKVGLLLLLVLLLQSRSYAEQGETENGDGQGFSIIATPSPLPTSPYGLRPIYKHSHSKVQNKSPELGNEAPQSDEETKSKAEQELDQVFGQ